MNSFQRKVFSGFVRPIVFLLLFNLVAMILWTILPIFVPEYLYIVLEDKLHYLLLGVAWVYFVMRARWYAAERTTGNIDAEGSDLTGPIETKTSLKEIRARIRSHKAKEV